MMALVPWIVPERRDQTITAENVLHRKLAARIGFHNLALRQNYTLFLKYVNINVL
jgi:hypothetical protein